MYFTCFIVNLRDAKYWSFATNSIKGGVVTYEETRFFNFGSYCNNYSANHF